MLVRVTGMAIAAALLCAPTAAAQEPDPNPSEPFAPWDGSNPFKCVLQDVGEGTEFPDPDADPFCVSYDKTQQNVTGFGIFEFLANEPARFAAAGPKCFYYQSDHWTGSIVQGEDPELWHWDGQYFFDKARGVGGVNVQNFRILGQPASPSEYGEVPPEFAPYMDQGGGGALIFGNVEADPECAARVDTPEEQAQVYASDPPAVVPDTGGGASAAGAPIRVVPAVVTPVKRKRCTTRGKKRGAKRGKKRGKRAEASARKKGCKKKRKKRKKPRR